MGIKGLFGHTGFLGNSVRGGALEGLVCATAACGFLLFGYDREFSESGTFIKLSSIRGHHVRNHHRNGFLVLLP
jgi:hypothetical protein